MSRLRIIVILLPVLASSAYSTSQTIQKTTMALMLLRSAKTIAIQDDAMAAYVCEEASSLPHSEQVSGSGVHKATYHHGSENRARPIGFDAHMPNLESCFRRATQSDDIGLRQQLEVEIAKLIIDSSTDEAPAIIAEADARVRGALRSTYLERLISQHRLKEATAQLWLMPRDETFPFGAAIHLMMATHSSQENNATFGLAMEAYRKADLLTSGVGSLSPTMDDFGALIVHFWREISREEILEAIDLLLSKTKEQENAGLKFSISLGSDHSNASFPSTYQFRLFEILPILKKIDPEKYSEYLAADTSLRSDLGRLPNGLASIDVSYGSPSDIQEKATDRFAVEFAGAALAAPIAPFAEQMTEVSLLNHSGSEAEALKKAMELPLQGGIAQSPRLEALMMLARNDDSAQLGAGLNATYAADTAAMTLDPEDRLIYLAQIAACFSRFQQTDEAERVLFTELADIRSSLLQRDTYEQSESTKGDDSQGRTSKLFWSSTAANRIIVFLEASTDPEKAIGFANGVIDPDVKAVLYVDIARRLLGTKNISLVIKSRYLDGNIVVRSFQIGKS